MTDAAAPALPHLTVEFFVWLWYASEREGGTFQLGSGVGVADCWVDERLSFRLVDEDKARAVLTGEDTSSSAEAKAALASGKVVRDVQLHLRREEREYTVTLRGPNLDLASLKLPPHEPSGEEELLYERMFLYEDIWTTIAALYKRFAMERTSKAWHTTILPAIRAWAGGAEPQDLAWDPPVEPEE